MPADAYLALGVAKALLEIIWRGKLTRPIFQTAAHAAGASSQPIASILQTLSGWVGFPSMEQAMREFPDTDVFLAGGGLRDAIQPNIRPLKDFDFFIGSVHVDAFLSRIAQTGRLEQGPFGSPRWFPVRHAEIYADIIPIKSFYNGLWQCADILDVLNQFDFTANALALNLRSGAFIDPQNGVRDAQARILRAVRFDYPDEPLPSDARLSRLGILWIRLLHYAHALDYAIEPVTQKWLVDHAQYRSQANAFSEVFFTPQIGVISAA